ncbi:dolichyl-phosphate beta-glucosyltransferase [Tilletia horrida]|nr:dolichyl-phosphate beta-glucosyltransferase [Tilletia horrida]
MELSLTSALTLLSIPILLLLVSLYPLLVFITPHSRGALPSELHYYTVKEGSSAADVDAAAQKASKDKLGTLKDDASVQLSVIIPAYNEEERLPVMLTETVEYLEKLRTAKQSLAGVRPAGATSKGKSNGAASTSLSLDQALREPLTSYEIVIVDDGSKDKTIAVALSLAHKLNLTRGSARELRVVKLEQNRGKGGAVRHGILHARGALILFADADGATRFSDLSPLCAELDRVRTPTGHGAVVGSRAHLVGSEAVVKRSFIRNFLMHSFHLFLSLLLRPPSPSRLLRQWQRSRASTKAQPLAQPEIRDTQCGFKLFTRATSLHIFPLSHIDRWIFDVELLMLAEMASEKTLRSGAGPVQRPTANGTSGKATPKKKSNGVANGTATSAQVDVLLRLPVPIAEVPVHWAEVSGSKIELLKDSIGMALDLLILRANYALGRWASPGVVPI